MIKCLLFYWRIYDPDFLYVLTVHLLDLVNQHLIDQPVQHRLVQFLNSCVLPVSYTHLDVYKRQLLSWIMSVTQVSTVIIEALSAFILNKYVYLLVLMLLLFVVGALMDTVAAIIIIAPVIVPMGIQLGLDPLHLGMIFVINLVIGYVTPPFGYNLFTACSVTGLKFNQVVKGVLPFLLIEMAAVMLFAYVPSLTTWLPDLLAGS